MPMQPRPWAATVRPSPPRARLGIAMRHDIVTKRNGVVSECLTSRMSDAATAARARPRSAEADAAIQDATVDLLATEGYAARTMPGVAQRPGAPTATLQRRWHRN